MKALADAGIVHRDLAARNVLVDKDLGAKVADFGLSRVGHSSQKFGLAENEDYYRSQKGIFPVRWTAPEAMETLVFNQASDVWSFGVLLVELVQDGDRPYYDLKSNSDVVALTMSGCRHQQPHGCSNALFSVMCRCWDVEPRKRPSFTALTVELDQLRAHTGLQNGRRDVASGSFPNQTEAAAAAAAVATAVADSTAAVAAGRSFPGGEVSTSIGFHKISPGQVPINRLTNPSANATSPGQRVPTNRLTNPSANATSSSNRLGNPSVNVTSVDGLQMSPTSNFEELYSFTDANFDALVAASNAEFDALVVASSADFDALATGESAGGHDGAITELSGRRRFQPAPPGPPPGPASGPPPGSASGSSFKKESFF
jgi:serine/threonine protein kinase